MTAIPAGLAPASEVIEAVRAARTGSDRGASKRIDTALRRFGPAIDELADADRAAEWLGISRDSIYRERGRNRADGAAAWPEADVTAGRSALWSYRTLAKHRASMPGRGSAGRGRPRSVQAG